MAFPLVVVLVVVFLLSAAGGALITRIARRIGRDVRAKGLRSE